MKTLFLRLKEAFNFFKTKKERFSIKKVNNNYFILRHGETLYTAGLRNTIYPKSTRFELGITEEGEKDVKNLIPQLQKEKIDIIVASDFLRTQITARLVAKGLGIEITSDKRLRDVNLGVYEGGEKQKFYDEVDPQIMLEEGVPEGESWLNCMQRVGEVIKDLERKYKNKNILIVSHGDPLWLLEKGIAQKQNLQKMAQARYNTPIIQPGELRKINFR